MYLINDSMANKQDKLHAEDFFLTGIMPICSLVSRKWLRT